MGNTGAATGFLEEVNLLLRRHWDVLAGRKSTDVKTLSAHSKPLVKRVLGMNNADHHIPYSENTQSYNRVMGLGDLTQSMDR